MTEALKGAAVAFLGVAGGIAVGSGFVAFLVVLDIIPRLAQMTKSYGNIRAYEGAVIAGVLFFTLADFYGWKADLFPLGAAVFGLFAGCFVGMLAAALTEVVNVLPILARRIGLADYIAWLLLAMILGKVAGSLFEWLVYVKEG
ncbi:stage V sporulation protein AB [Gordoniibacillus kamchatkensis]|uniref:Stage V sporulation protein AB n=1 Tax=Gordoniibacillus kamchatkensis TaxID=1590651 RepID=A0ABR5A9Y4_9BACL|nr:stage V sporulation protein AB [Paenibacillus sp. VKM B-2647]KIL37791.1 stage V sporulation protein AB [Paenibacillus sp. VKM B-2647]